MALNPTSIMNSFKAKLDSLDYDETTSDAEAKEAYAQVMADWIIETITSATITIPSGTIITVGSPSTQTQSVPGIVNDGIS